MTVAPYLFFGGNCAEAMRFYERTLGGKLEIMTFADAPAGEAPPGIDASKIMHSSLTLDGGGLLMASDDPSLSEPEKARGVAISLDYPTTDDARRIFDALADGGETLMPMEKTFWSEGFGMATDRFGTMWMVSVASKDH
jgi:PhnB protein